MKAYILVKNSLPRGWAALSAAHAALKMYLEYKDDEVVKDWIEHSFRKVICGVSDEEFAEAKEEKDSVVFIEDDLGAGYEVAIGIKPRRNWPDRYRKYKLLK